MYVKDIGTTDAGKWDTCFRSRLTRAVRCARKFPGGWGRASRVQHLS